MSFLNNHLSLGKYVKMSSILKTEDNNVKNKEYLEDMIIRIKELDLNKVKKLSEKNYR